MAEDVSALDVAGGAGRRVALVGVFLCIFLGALDQTIVSTALPRIVQDLGGTALYAWVATSYLLASTIALPVAGRLADMVSPKYVLIGAAGVFLIGSALSGLSPDMQALILFRGIQGLGGGAIFAVASTVIGLLFPPRQRGRVQGLFGAVFGLASVVGPYLGGVLTDSFSWRWVFYVNMPVGAVALYVLLVHMPTMRPAHRQPFDGIGTATLVLWTAPLLLALSWAGSTYPFTSPVIIGLLAGALAVLAVFYWWQRREPAPLFDLALLKNRTFLWAGLGTLFFGAAFLGSVLFLPLYLVDARGISPTASGLMMTPLTLGVVIGSVTSGQVAARTGRVKPFLLIGNLWAAGLFLVIAHLLTVTMAFSELAILMVLLGIGIGPGFPLYTLAVQNVVRREQMGVASSGNQFLRQIGSALGAAVMGSLLAATLTTAIPAHLPPSVRHHGPVAGLGSNQLESTATIRRVVLAKFLVVGREVTAALRGNRRAYAVLVTSSEVPARDRALLVPGGIPAEVHREAHRTLALVAAALAGHAAAVQALVADSLVPAAVRPLLSHPPATAAARALLLSKVDGAVHAMEPHLVATLERRILPVVAHQIRRSGETVAAEVVAAIGAGVTTAIRRVFEIAGLLALLAFGAGLALPAIELRRTHHAPADAPGPCEEVASP